MKWCFGPGPGKGAITLDFCLWICDPSKNIKALVFPSRNDKLQISPTSLDGVLVITPARHGDHRGFFSESWNRQRLLESGVDIDFVQDNHSLSAEVGTVRGLHFQSPPHAQDKLVRCGQGSLFDVVVDVRKGSPTYGQWVGQMLSFENGKQLLVPKGFLHGFMTLQPNTEIIYKCSDFYAPECDGAVRWDSCGIEWPIDVAAPVLSQKDMDAQTLAEFQSPFSYEVAP